MDRWVLPRRWKWILAAWTIALLLLAGIPQIGIAVLNYQADECSVLVDGQQQVLRGGECQSVMGNG